MKIVTDTEPEGITDTDIVAGLRSADQERRQKALSALFPEPGESAVLIHATTQNAMVATTRRVDVGRLFNAMLFVAQSLGKHLGLSLQWIHDQRAAMQEQDKIQVVPGDALPR